MRRSWPSQPDKRRSVCTWRLPHPRRAWALSFSTVRLSQGPVKIVLGLSEQHYLVSPPWSPGLIHDPPPKTVHLLFFSLPEVLEAEHPFLFLLGLGLELGNLGVETIDHGASLMILLPSVTLLVEIFERKQQIVTDNQRKTRQWKRFLTERKQFFRS